MSLNNLPPDISKSQNHPGNGNLAVRKEPLVPWNPWVGVFFVVAIYFLSQQVGALGVSVYPLLKGWNHAQALSWLMKSISAQFFYVLIAEIFTIAAIYVFLRAYKTNFKAIALRKPRFKDIVYGLAAVVPYYIIFILSVGVVKRFAPGLNVNQSQQIGFSGVQGITQIALTFISLVILPPIAEEIMVRGLLYGSLKKGMPQLAALLVTSIIFASAHLPEGGAAGPLYIAALDTFILSLFLIYLREKTGNLWASITLHSLKNGMAFIALFILKLH